MNVRIDLVLNLWNPFFVKFTEVVVKLLWENSISWVLSETSHRIDIISAYSPDGENWLLSWEVFFCWFYLNGLFCWWYCDFGSQAWSVDLNFLWEGNVFCQMSVFEPVWNSVEEKSETICSSFPSLQTSNQWSWSNLTPVVSSDVFDSESGSWDFKSPTQLDNAESRTLIINFQLFVCILSIN